MQSGVVRPSSNTVVVKSADRAGVTQAVTAHVERLRRNHPELLRVIWFGSWGNGIPIPGSDVDLCLVISSPDIPMRERASDYYPIGFPVGVDLVVYTQEEFDRLAIESPAWHRAISTGQEL